MPAPHSTKKISARLRLLYEAGIPALVLLSKSDLLANGDLHRTISYIEAQLKHELGIAATVHAVSALSKYQVLLDQFFERELLPRFEKARFLREASITRKIGAMRDAIMAALDSNLHREKRAASPVPAIASDVESVLRVVTGEVGEQHTVLDHAFRTLGETPDAVMETVTDKATSFMRSTSQHQVSPLQFSEWIHEAINDSIQSAMETLRNVGKGAVDRLQQIAKELGRSDAPSQNDFEAILREMPRFEMATLPAPFDAWALEILGPQNTAFPDQSQFAAKYRFASQRRSAPLRHGIVPMERPDCAEAGTSDKFIRRRLSNANPSLPWNVRFGGESRPAPGGFGALAELASGEQRHSYGYSCMKKGEIGFAEIFVDCHRGFTWVPG